MDAPFNILVVEDDAGYARWLLDTLQNVTWSPPSVTLAARLDEAIAHLRTDAWGAVLLDLHLPDSEGVDTFLQLSTYAPHVPIVVLTSMHNEEAAMAALARGAQEYVVKSEIDALSLDTTIRHAIARHAYNDAFRTTEARYRSLVEGAVQGILIHVDGVITFANQALANLIGFRSPDEMIGRQIWPFIHEDDREVVAEYLHARQAHERAPERYELRVRRTDGETRWVDCGVSEMQWDGELTIMAALVDVTDRHVAVEQLRISDAQLRQAQKMEAIGALAGGIAHDFNNLLVVIGGYADLLSEDLGPRHPLRREIEEIRAASRSAASLTRQLLVFSRRQILQPQIIDVNQILERVERLLRRVIGEDIVLTMHLRGPLSPVYADPGQIEQVLMNLAVNARDAMPKGGRLTIETADVELDDAYAAQHRGSMPGPHVMLAVSDTGVGIDEATQERLFEPFFTTKPAGRGTGLGLATVYGIVKQSQGSIWVYSEVGKGSTFKIYLPAVAHGELQVPERPSEIAVLDGSERILLLEDQPEVRDMIAATLRRHGYSVLPVATSADALALVRNASQPIDLLLTDVVLPDVGGRDIARQIVAERPDVRVLYMSGYTDDAIVRHGVLDVGLAFIQKPFSNDLLLRKVRSVLDGDPPMP